MRISMRGTELSKLKKCSSPGRSRRSRNSEIRQEVGRVGLIGRVAIVLAVLISNSVIAKPDRLATDIASYLSAQFQSTETPGLAAAVVIKDQVIFCDAFGSVDLSTEEELTPQHIFHFASVSKPFVATAIMQLQERGLLNLDDLVIDHIPYFRLSDKRYKNITIRQMLNHTSGMPDVEDYEWERPQVDDQAAERYVRSLDNSKLLWEPGSDWQYSNIAFDVLGDLIAKVSGESFESFMESQIFEPLGMNNSSYIYPDIDEALRTRGHVGVPAVASNVYPYNRRHAPSSTLNSSVDEMVNWVLANLNRGTFDGNRILETDNFEELWTSSTDVIPVDGDFQVGLSWFLRNVLDHRVAWHAGTDTGFTSIVILLPDDGIGIVLASNWEEADLRTLGLRLIEIILQGLE